MATRIKVMEFMRDPRGKEKYLVDYGPPRGQRWVPGFMLGGPYLRDMQNVKDKYESVIKERVLAEKQSDQTVPTVQEDTPQENSAAPTEEVNLIDDKDSKSDHSAEQSVGKEKMDPNKSGFEQLSSMDKKRGVGQISGGANGYPSGSPPLKEMKDNRKVWCVCSSRPNDKRYIRCGNGAHKAHCHCMGIPVEVLDEQLAELEKEGWWCPFCRLQYMDPFSVGRRILATAITGESPHNVKAPRTQLTGLSPNPPTIDSKELQLRFTVSMADMAEWKLQGLKLVVRCVQLGDPTGVSGYGQPPKGPCWPKEVAATVNRFRDAFRIEPAKPGHKRREIGEKPVSDLIYGGHSNLVILNSKIEMAPDKRYLAERKYSREPMIPLRAPRFLFAVVLVAPHSPEQVLKHLVAYNNSPIEKEKTRDLKIIQALNHSVAETSDEELVCETQADFDILSTRCPLSWTEIDLPVRGIKCQHLQPYDANGYIWAQYKMANLEKRWHCPICYRITRPEDLRVDSFAKKAIQEVRGAVNLDEGGGGKQRDLGDIAPKRLKLSDSGEWTEVKEEVDGEASDSDDSPRSKAGTEEADVVELE